MRNARRCRDGKIAVLVAASLTCVIGVAALALDGGMLVDQRRRVQAGADAAALAAAVDLYANYRTSDGQDTSGTAKASALSNAASNGYANDGVSSIVTVNIPPLSGNHVGASGYAEVIVQYNQARGFSSLFGRGALPVAARAVARGMWTTFNNGIIVLDPTSSGSMDATGGGNIAVNNASIIVDSDSASGGLVKGNGSITAGTFELSGNPGYSTSGGGQMIGTINSSQTPVPDPLAYLPEPNPANLPVQSTKAMQISSSGTTTLQPGVYDGGIAVSGQASIVLSPGIYYMNGGGFSMTGSGSLTGNGVMIYNAPTKSSDVISLAGTGAVNMTPMTTGIYQGISLFQDRSSSNAVSVTGQGNMSITGTFYAAGAQMNIAGNGTNNVIGSQYISYDLKLSGNGAINVNWNANNSARQRILGLVE